MFKFAAPIFAAPVHAYICRQRDQLRSHASTLTENDRIPVERYFRPEVLDSVRILLADQLPIPEPPLASVMRRCGFDFPRPSLTEAITFEDVIASREAMNASLLFHELVHVVQYRVLGVREFARQYVSGFLDTSSYSEVPLERTAFDLQFRFETDAHFLYGMRLLGPAYAYTAEAEIRHFDLAVAEFSFLHYIDPFLAYLWDVPDKVLSPPVGQKTQTANQRRKPIGSNIFKRECPRKGIRGCHISPQ